MALCWPGREGGTRVEGWLRRPAVLLAVSAGISVFAGPWLRAGGVPHSHVVQVLAVVVLAVATSCGSRAARVVLISLSVTGVLIMLFDSPASAAEAVPMPRLLLLACYLAQICLLVSTPVYARARPGWSPGRVTAGPLLPGPRLWALAAASAAGGVITALPFASLRPLGCPPGHPATAGRGPCLAQGTGYPVAYRFDGGIVQIHAGSFHWLFAAAPGGVQAAALAADWAMWSLGILHVLYLSWLSIHREDPAPAPAAALPASP